MRTQPNFVHIYHLQNTTVVYFAGVCIYVSMWYNIKVVRDKGDCEMNITSAPMGTSLFWTEHNSGATPQFSMYRLGIYNNTLCTTPNNMQYAYVPSDVLYYAELWGMIWLCEYAQQSEMFPLCTTKRE